MSGNIALDGEAIRYRALTYGNWDLTVGDVRVMGEATNQSGPFADDYFLCFAVGPHIWYEASVYASGCDAFLDALGCRLGTHLELGLANSTDFASRVLWPPALAGQPMFKFIDVPPRTWIGKLMGPSRNTQTYTEAVAAILSSNS